MADQPKYGTKPVVLVDDVQLPDDIAAALSRVVVDTSVDLPDLVELTFVDSARDMLGRARLTIGSVVEVQATPRGDGTLTSLVTAEVATLELSTDSLGTRTVVRGYDHAHRLTRGRRTHSYNDVTDGDVVREVAQRAGLDVGTVDDGGVSYPHVTQANQTDLEFLAARGRESGREVAVLAGALHWRRPAAAADAPAPAASLEDRPQPFQLVLGANLRRFRARVTAAGLAESVEVRSWDPERKEAIVARAGSQARNAGIPQGSADVARTFPGADLVSVRRPLATQAEADALAAAIAESLGDTCVEADGVADGDPRLVAGASVAVTGAGSTFDGRYVLSSARHDYDEHGYRVVFAVTGRHDRTLAGLTAGPAGDASPPAGVVVAQVTDVGDPQQQGRVKVAFPWLADDYESWWARVAAPGAGADRGIAWLPEVNDEVLVAFEHGDMRRPYVLGGLWNGVDAPPQTGDLVASGEVAQRVLVSRTGHRLVLDDGSSSSGITLSTGDGKLSVALDGSGTTVTVNSSGKVEIKGSQSVSVESDGSVSIHAKTSLDLKGDAGVTIDGGPKVVVSGSVIQLN